MALLLAEASKNEVNDLHRGIATNVVQRSALYNLIPFKQTGGDLYQYVRENALPTAAWAAENGDLNSSEPTYSKLTETLKTLYWQGDVSGIAMAKGRASNPAGELVFRGSKALGNQYKSDIIAATGASNSIKGIKQLATDASRDDIGSASTDGDAISFTLLRTLRDNMKLGMSAYVVSYRTYRSIEALMDAAGGARYTDFGGGYGPVLMFDGYPVIPDDAVVINETQGSTTTCTRVHAVLFDEVEGLAGIYSDAYPLGFNVQNLGALEGKDNFRYRVTWYTSLVPHSQYAIGSLKGITN